MVVRGKISESLKVFASEVYQDPNIENSSWIIDQPRIVHFHHKDTKTAIAQANSKSKNNHDLKQVQFTQIYMRFESMTDCAFSIEITFPEEEDFQRRKKVAEKNNESLLQRSQREEE